MSSLSTTPPPTPPTADPDAPSQIAWPDTEPHRWLTSLLNGSSYAYIVAPMVDQSDLPFRFLSRRYSSNLCYTPMIHSRMFTTDVKYREKFMPKFDEAKHPMGGPVFHQFCGNNEGEQAGRSEATRLGIRYLRE